MKQKLFPYIIALSALSVSASAAFYSVFGLSHLFAGASTQVIIMASALEAAKLVVASLLYQYWDTINKFLRFYFVLAVFILMVITSGGIYGYLSGAYAETATQSEFLDKQVAIIDQKRTRFIEQRDDFKTSVKELTTALSNPTMIQYVDKETGQLVTTTSSRQRRLLQSQLTEAKVNLNAVTDSIAHLDVLILDTQINNESARELGPLKYIASLANKSMDQIINWFMLLIVFVFDPLAIGMVVAANMAFSRLKPKMKEGIKTSVPEGAKFDEWYSVKEPTDIPEENKEALKKLEEINLEKLSQKDKEIEILKKRIEENKIVKKHPKFPPESKEWILKAAKHAQRAGKKVPNFSRFFD
jgi:hypothetical protein